MDVEDEYIGQWPDIPESSSIIVTSSSVYEEGLRGCRKVLVMTRTGWGMYGDPLEPSTCFLKSQSRN